MVRRAEFGHTGVLGEVGGTAYLTQPLAAAVGIINAGEYACTIPPTPDPWTAHARNRA